MKYKIKLQLLIFIFLFISLFTTGCGVNNEKTVSEIESNMKKEIKFENMVKGNNKDLKRFYHINMNDYDGVILYIPKSTMDVSEVLIVKVKDKSQIESLEDIIDTRIASQLKSFSGYGPKQCKLINDYELKTKGNFLIFTISKNAQEIKESFLDSIKQ